MIQPYELTKVDWATIVLVVILLYALWMTEE